MTTLQNVGKSIKETTKQKPQWQQSCGSVKERRHTARSVPEKPTNSASKRDEITSKACPPPLTCSEYFI